MCASCYKSLFFTALSHLLRYFILNGFLVAIAIFACSQKAAGDADANVAGAKDEQTHPWGATEKVPKLLRCKYTTETQLQVPCALSRIEPGVRTHPGRPAALPMDPLPLPGGTAGTVITALESLSFH